MQSPMRQDFSSVWQTAEERFLSWDIRNTTVMTLDGEYKRDLGKGLDIQMPKNYYENDDCKNKPLLLWRAHANNLYTNWLNYYVYQSTPFDLIGTPDFSSISMD